MATLRRTFHLEDEAVELLRRLRVKQVNNLGYIFITLSVDHAKLHDIKLCLWTRHGEEIVDNSIFEVVLLSLLI